MDILDWVFSIVVNSVAILITAYVLPGVIVKGFWSAAVAAIVLGLVNAFIRPVIVFFTLPLTFITFGLFLLVINALMVLLAAAILPGFSVKNFWWAMAFSVILAVVNSFLFWIF